MQISWWVTFPLTSFSEKLRNCWEWRTGGAATLLEEAKQEEKVHQLRAATPIFLLLQALQLAILFLPLDSLLVATGGLPSRMKGLKLPTWTPGRGGKAQSIAKLEGGKGYRG